MTIRSAYQWIGGESLCLGFPYLVTMSLVRSQISHRDSVFSLSSSFSSSSSSSSSWLSTSNHNFFQRDRTPDAPSSPSVGKISPAVLFIIIILAVVFFISGFLHLLVRILKKQRSSSSFFESNRYPENVSASDAFQRQLQQLFNHHDSGLDQAFIDTLPVFQYKEIVGLKEPFDCAVCLCEFSEQDRLRLLPLCSHAFHIDCIDKWLTSNSSCPLCRSALYTPGLGIGIGIGIENPVFDLEDLRDHEDGVGIPCNLGTGRIVQKPVETELATEKRVFPVRLGKFRRTNNEEQGSKDIDETSTSTLDARRCYSMGSYQYVFADSILQVALCPKKPLTSRGDAADSELKTVKGRCGQNGNSTASTNTIGDAEARKITAVRKNESLSVSKIWLWSKKGKFQHSSNTDFSGIHVDMSLPWTSRDQAM